MHITSAAAPVDAPWVDVLGSGVQRAWLAAPAFGGSRFAQVSVLTIPPATQYSAAAHRGERICVVVDGGGELVTTDESTAVAKGALINSRTGGTFTLRTRTATTKLLILEQVARGSTTDVDEPQSAVDGRTSTEHFSLYDVPDEVLHQPDAGFYDMTVRMLLSASQKDYRSFILGQSSFSTHTGMHALHRHPGADEIFYVWEGEGVHLDDHGTEHVMRTGDAVFVPRYEWHGFRNSGDRTVRAFFSLIGTGVMQHAGNEVLADGAPRNVFAASAEGLPASDRTATAQTEDRAN